jgi:F0F1-type ATP synthase assembly protein I
MDKKNIREIAISSALYSLGAILGPLLLIGGSGYLLDYLFNTKPIILIFSVLIAFIVTNILLFKKIKKINQLMDKFRDEVIKEKMAEAGSKISNQQDK